MMSSQKPHDESSSLKNKRKPYQQSKLFIAAVILLALLILQRVFITPLPALAAHSQADMIRQRATLPPEWTATYTLSPATAVVETPLPTLTLGGQSVTAVPLSAMSSVNTGKKLIVDIDFLALHTQPLDSASIIEMAPRGSVKTILTDTKSTSDNLTWYYVSDGFGWIPATLNGISTVRDYSPDALNQMMVEIDVQLKTDSQNPTLKLQKGWMYYSQQQYDAAASEISDAIAAMDANSNSDPKAYAHLYDYRGHVYLDQENYANAAKDFDQAIILGLHEAAVYDRRGIAFQNLQQYDQSRADYEEAIKLDPKYGLLYNNLGALLDLIYKQNPEQVDYYTKAIEVDPYFPYGYSNRAIYYQQSGDIGDHVIDDFTAALQLLPDNKDIRNSRGVVYSHRGDYSSAINDFERVIQDDPKYVASYTNMGLAYYEMGDKNGAVKIFLKAIKLDDPGGTAYYDLGVILHMDGQIEAALYCYNKALEINPNRNDARTNRADIYKEAPGLDENRIMSTPSVETLITPIS